MKTVCDTRAIWDFRRSRVGACGLWGRGYCDVEKLLADKGEIERWKDTFARYDLEISALGGHGAPLMPNKAVADTYSREFRRTCEFMELAGIRRITLLAGLPEGAEGDTAPNWVTFSEWPFLRDTLVLAVGKAPAAILARAREDRRRPRCDDLLRDCTAAT